MASRPQYEGYTGPMQQAFGEKDPRHEEPPSGRILLPAPLPISPGQTKRQLQFGV
jgi:hypothetical protein